MTQPAGRRWLVAILIDESEMVDDDDVQLTTSEAVLAYLNADLSDHTDMETRPAIKVVGPGPAADEAFEAIDGPQG